MKLNKIIRLIYLALYRLHLYMPNPIGDGVTNNHRAFQTMLDAGEGIMGSHTEPGTYYFKGTLDCSGRTGPSKGIMMKRLFFLSTIVICGIALALDLLAVFEIPYSERIIVWALYLIACGLFVED